MSENELTPRLLVKNRRLYHKSSTAQVCWSIVGYSETVSVLIVGVISALHSLTGF